MITADVKHAKVGTVSVALFTGMALLSLNVVRRRFFELFRAVHWLFPLAYLFLVLHTSQVVLYGFAPAILYLYDRVRRCSWALCAQYHNKNTWSGARMLWEGGIATKISSSITI